MKWTNQKRQPYSKTKTGIKAQKNRILFEIDDYTQGWGVEHLGWYACVTEVKIDKRFNSLWKNLWWKDIEEAKQWCEDFKWEIVMEE